MKYFSIIALAFLIICCGNRQEESETKFNENTNTKEVLLIGTFHYNNPGADVAKTKSFDILNNDSQLELKEISTKITAYNPTKIFVEWPHEEQKELDSLYKLYRNGTYFDNDSLSDFYLKNEIFQLAFRVAKENDLEKLYAIDYSTSFPFEDVMKEIEENNQTELKRQIEEGISKFTVDFDQKIESGTSLTELTYFLNSQEMRKMSNNFHINLMLLAGGIQDFSGPLLASEWYKRNLYMWSLIQKNVTESDQRIMVLVGSSHAAMFELFIKENDHWNVKELKQVMEK
ncbi:MULTISPECIES: DUF5694 domain-containing protein [Maribacter]|uniref:DUF5694 domain-containing protein n=1 Tax=Maribacter flavus TaxID=1658664 RepID=A0ABU7IMJ7_9FLAO|nr:MULTISPECIES: DUF5694 domain-containing protein [Maribacter]MDC6406151.1 DUF5694 domain-containing protein [Maribacter sp. PR66]MEE1974194.1 DUF5694 domain-containing protein [Maribacter flavus]